MRTGGGRIVLFSNGTRGRVQSGDDQGVPVAEGQKQSPSAAPEERRRKRDGAEKGEKGQKSEDNKQWRKKQDGSADSSSATGTKQ